MLPQSPVLPKQNGMLIRHSEVIYAKDQPEYISLPAIKTLDGEVITRWQLTWKERIKVLFSGNIWLSLLTFNQNLQPIKLHVDEPQLPCEY